MIELRTERCLPLTSRRASRVICHQGLVWLTPEGDAWDVFLQPGDGADIGCGLTLASALSLRRWR